MENIWCKFLLLASILVTYGRIFSVGGYPGLYKSPRLTRRSLVEENCGLDLCGKHLQFDSCQTLPSTDGSDNFRFFWNLAPLENGTITLSGAIDAASSGWAGWGFPGPKGGMVNGSAIIVKHDDSQSGASADCYFMAGKSRSSVAPPCPLHVTDLAACGKEDNLQASFKILLSNSVEELQSNAVQTINAIGAIDSTGALRKHPGSGNKASVELGRALRRRSGTPAPSPKVSNADGLAYHAPTAPVGSPAPPYVELTKTGISEQPRDGKNTQGKK
eukprot:jgi/Botrbrau1/9278/Bobra.0111s0006.1